MRAPRSNQKTILYFKCWRCDSERQRENGKPPGDCVCGTTHPWPWKVSSEPFPTPSRGFVKVYKVDEKGNDVVQELHGPYWRENPDKWRPTTAMTTLGKHEITKVGT